MMLHDYSKLRRSKLRRGLLLANLILLFAAATLCRALLLDHVPGLNGDEAWQGVQVQRALRGESVSWRTPTGNPINPLSFLPMAALHLWLPPSIVLLRLTPLVSGLAALAINYALCRRVFDRRLAAVSTVILAVLPAMVAYSRFAWDASQSVLVTLGVMYCALGAVREPRNRRGWLLCSAAAMCLAWLVHPTNVFVAPLVVAAAAWCWRMEWVAWLANFGRPRFWERSRHAPSAVRWPGYGTRSVSTPLGICCWKPARLVNAPLPMMVFLGVLLCCGVAASRYSQVAAAAGRLCSPSQATLFFGRVVDLLSGTTVYRYIPATQLNAMEPATFAYRLAAWITLAAAGYGLWHSLRFRRRTAARVLLVGFCAGLAAFYVVAGPQAIRPHFERYGMWMIGPSALLTALGIRWWMRRLNCRERLHPAVALLLAWTMLAGFGWYYLRPLSLGLGDTHVAFRTAKVEPKLMALRWIEQSQGTDACFARQGDSSILLGQNWDSPRIEIPRIEIVARGWWVYWPLAYLAGADHRLSIVPENVPGETPSDTSRAWHVSWVDDPEAWGIQASSPQEAIVFDAASRPLLRVVRPETTETMAQPAFVP